MIRSPSSTPGLDANVASLANQINNGPILFALLEMIQCQS